MNSQPLRHLTVVASSVICLLLLPACSTSTTVENETTAEGVTKLSFKKIVAIVPARDPKRRRAAEHEFKAKLTRVVVIPSYTLIPSEADLKDLAKVRAAVQASGADGVVVLRPTSYHTESNTVREGSTHNVTAVTSFGGYYGGYYSGDYSVSEYSYKDNDSVRSSKVLLIEAKLFEFPSERQVWTARVVSSDPSNPKQVISDAIDAIRAVMVRDNLIPDHSSSAK